MEVKIQRTAFYFSWPDDEILDEKTLNVTGDDETWLYRVEQGSHIGHFQTPIQPNHHHAPSGSVDSRTFTRRKHALRPSLKSVAESPLSNRSSLGILSASQINDTKLMDCSITPVSTNQGRISSNFIASDKTPAPRVFKLNTPFMNYPIERKRHDSEVSDNSILPSLDSQFDKHESMTDSLVNFLEKPCEKCQPPDDFKDEKPMTESLVSLPDKGNGFEFHEEAMTDSMVNFLEPVACKPPSGFEDEEMSNSIVNIDEKDVLPAADMTNSLMDYLDSVNIKTSLTQSTVSNEAENIPPINLSNGVESYSNSNQKDRVKSVIDDRVNNTFEIEKEVDGTLNVEDNSKKSPNITFTNNVNITRTKKEIRDGEDDRCITRPLNSCFGKEPSLAIDYDSNLKSRALNNRDLNVTQDLNVEDTNDFMSSKYNIPNKTNSTINNSRLNGTLTRSDLNSTFNMSRQIPKRNSTFNTTFTKLNSHAKDISSSRLPTHTLRGLNCTFTRSTDGLSGGVEDDQISSASDSSFSSGSTKPRSVDELRTIAQQQECSLVQSSTPTEGTREVAKNLAKLDLELSPIRRDSMELRRNTESRSAHCSPVRSHYPRSPLPHPITQLQQPPMEVRRQTLQASSLSNLARPRTTASRMPQPLSRVSMLARPESRPSTAPAPPAPTGIPRPQASRLPMPRSRVSGIPTMKRGRH